MNFENATPSFQISILEDVGTEPITVEDVKKFSSIDQDYTHNDTTIEMMIESCREKLEGALNVFFYQRKALLQFRGGACLLPYGPTEDVLEVSKNGTDVLDTDMYTIEGLNYKTVVINNSFYGCLNFSWFYPVWGGWPIPWTWEYGVQTFYNVKYVTGYEVLPKVLKHALLMLVDYAIKEQGTTDFDVPPAIMKMANRFSQNLVIQ